MDKEWLKEIEYGVSDNRLAKWSWDDVWNVVYFTWDWADLTAPATYNKDKNSVVSYAPSAPKKDRRVYFMNVPEELDMPGEWYLDRTAKILYLIPPKDIKSDDMLLFSAGTYNLFDVKGAENISFENIKIAGTTAMGINAEDSGNVTMDCAEFYDLGEYAVNFNRCTNSGVSNSYFHDLNSWGVYFRNCGDKKLLISSNCFVDNCEFERFSLYRLTSAPAI